MSDIPTEGVEIREGKGGRTPLSVVKTDSK